MAYIMKHDFQITTHTNTSLCTMKDRLSSFNIVTEASSTTEKHLKTDLESVQVSYEKKNYKTLHISDQNLILLRL